MFRCFRLKRLIAAVSALLVLLGAGFALIPTFADNSAEAPVSLPVIMYHSVCEKEPSPYTVTPRQLESDLSWLSDNGFESVTAEQLISYTRGVGKLPEKPVLITFDDGFYNNLSLALPLLEKYDMTAVELLISHMGGRFGASLLGTHRDRQPHLRPALGKCQKGLCKAPRRDRGGLLRHALSRCGAPPHGASAELRSLPCCIRLSLRLALPREPSRAP